MSSLAVIFTVYERKWSFPRIGDALRAQTRQPDEVIVMCELLSDAFATLDYWPEWRTSIYMTFTKGQNPIGVECNYALDHTDADYIVYLTDDSIPDPRKYEVMARALDENPEWGAVYCGQDYGTATGPEDWLAGGRHIATRPATTPEADPFTRVDHTQVMHRRCKARWPLSYGDRKLSDAHFFRDLVAEVGPLMPVFEVLDWTRQLPDGLTNR